MLNKIAKKVVYSLFDENEDREMFDVYIYGVELIISTLVCTALLILAGIITGTFIESIIFIVYFSAMRIVCGGYHSKSYLICNTLTVMMYLAIVLIYRLLYIYIAELYVVIPMMAVTLFIIILFVPVDNPPRSEGKKQRCKRKIWAIIIFAFVGCSAAIAYWIFAYSKIIVVLPTLLFSDVLTIVPLFLQKQSY